MADESDTIVLYPKRLRLVPLCATSGALAALCGYLAAIVPRASSCFEVLAIGAALSGVLFAFVVYRLAAPRSTVVIDHDGLIDRSTLTAPGRLAWSELERVTTFRCLAQDFVGIWLKNPAALLVRLPKVKARMVASAMRKGRPPVWIPAAAVSMAPAKLAELISGRLPGAPKTGF